MCNSILGCKSQYKGNWNGEILTHVAIKTWKGFDHALRFCCVNDQRRKSSWCYDNMVGQQFVKCFGFFVYLFNGLATTFSKSGSINTVLHSSSCCWELTALTVCNLTTVTSKPKVTTKHNHHHAASLIGNAQNLWRLMTETLDVVMQLLTTLCCKKVYHPTFNNNSNSSCPIPVIFGKVITE